MYHSGVNKMQTQTHMHMHTHGHTYACTGIYIHIHATTYTGTHRHTHIQHAHTGAHNTHYSLMSSSNFFFKLPNYLLFSSLLPHFPSKANTLNSQKGQSMVDEVCHPSAWKVETRGSGVQGLTWFMQDPVSIKTNIQRRRKESVGTEKEPQKVLVFLVIVFLVTFRALLVSPKATKNVPFEVDQWKKGERMGERMGERGEEGEEKRRGGGLWVRLGMLFNLFPPGPFPYQ